MLPMFPEGTHDRITLSIDGLHRRLIAFVIESKGFHDCSQISKQSKVVSLPIRLVTSDNWTFGYTPTACQLTLSSGSRI